MTESGSTYDGFISYSHAADDLLAPRLQSALQRFAKPWWKRRAVRIFRDESSLSANPHLWSSITEALDTSGWFVLLLSPDAARSEWVNQEIAYWVENRDAKKILPVVTDGTFGWADGDVTGDAVPEALQGVFTEEPRWVDVRWAKDEDQLDLQDPRFADAVADIASTIRGIPKDDLASEEVRQHRRTVRTAWAAGILVTVLALAAGGFAVQAGRNADEAQRLAEAESTARAQAEELADLEAAARAEAEQSASEAAEARDVADSNAALARARRLAAEAVDVVDFDPELAALLSIEAIDSAPADTTQPAALTNALWRVAQQDRLIAEIDLGIDALTYLDVSDDGTRIFVSMGVAGAVRMYDENQQLVWEYSEETVDEFTMVSVAADGSLAAVSVIDSQAEASNSGTSADLDDGRPNRTLVLDGETGDLLLTLEFTDCLGVEANQLSRDGRFIAVGSGLEGCERNATVQWVEIFETASGESVAFIPTPDFNPGAIPEFDGAGRLYLFGNSRTEIFESETFEPVGVLQSVGRGDVDAAGSVIVVGDGFRVSTHDPASDVQVDRIGVTGPAIANPLGVVVSPDGQRISVTTFGRYTYVYELQNGTMLYRLPSGPAPVSAFDIERNRLYTPNDGSVRIWDLGSDAVGLESLGDLGNRTWVNGNSFSIGPEYGALIPADLTKSFLDSWGLEFFDVSDGRLLAEEAPDAFRATALNDGRFAVNTVDEKWVFHTPGVGTSDAFLGCDIDEDGNCADTGEPARHYWVVYSVDQTEALAFSGSLFYTFDGNVVELDPATGTAVGPADEPWLDQVVFNEPLAFSDSWFLLRKNELVVAIDRKTGVELWGAPIFNANLEVSDSGRLIAGRTEGSQLVVVDTETWSEVRIAEDFGNVRGFSFNDDESRLALGSTERLFVVDIAERSIEAVVEIPGVSDVHWLSDESIVIGTNTGIWGRISIDTEDLLAETRAELRRSFTSEECVRYEIDPCPTLEEIRSR